MRTRRALDAFRYWRVSTELAERSFVIRTCEMWTIYLLVIVSILVLRTLTHMMRSRNRRFIRSTAHAGPWNIQSIFDSRIQVHSRSSWRWRDVGVVNENPVIQIDDNLRTLTLFSALLSRSVRTPLEIAQPPTNIAGPPGGKREGVVKNRKPTFWSSFSFFYVSFSVALLQIGQ